VTRTVIWSDPIKRRATIFGWISNACQGAEFTAWGFYLPVILVLSGVGVSSSGDIGGSNMVTAGIFCLATASGYVAPLMLPKIGHRGVAMWGFGLAFVGLVIGAIAIQYDWKIIIVIGACILMWGHYWDASNGMTVTSMVAPPRFKATASGFGYVFVKGAAFFGAFVFPLVSEALGKSGATLAVAIISMVGFLSAKYILPEMYGYVETEEVPASKL
jgi:MFS family permease